MNRRQPRLTSAGLLINVRRRVIMRIAKTLLRLGGVALVPSATTAYADPPQSQSTPNNFNYEIKDGKRVPKGNRIVNKDGSWREEIRHGHCVKIKEMSADS